MVVGTTYIQLKKMVESKKFFADYLQNFAEKIFMNGLGTEASHATNLVVL